MPQAVRGFLPSDFIILRLETWRRDDDGRYTGMADVDVPGTPASATGQMGLRDAGHRQRTAHPHGRHGEGAAARRAGSRARSASRSSSCWTSETAFTLDWMNRNA